jgi:hypothetical protein
MKPMKCLKISVFSILLATTIYIVLAVPGFLTDEASVVPIDKRIATVQP